MKETQQHVMDIHFSEVYVSILSDNVLKFFFEEKSCCVMVLFYNLITHLVLLQFMVLLILRHTLPLILNGTNNVSFPVFMVKQVGLLFYLEKTLMKIMRAKHSLTLSCSV